MSTDPYATHPRPVSPPTATHLVEGACFTIRAAAATDTGQRRANNEDTFLQDRVPGQTAAFAVFDGMGGMAAGEWASTEARQAFERILTHPDATQTAPTTLLRTCVEAANQAILDHVAQHPGRRGMGSTVVAVLVRGQALHVISLGDSRLYRIGTTGEVSVMTQDHSVVAILVENGEMTPEEARTSDLRNKLLGALGEVELPPPFETHTALRFGERFVLCSDGLWDMLSDARIGELVRSATTPDEAVVRLITAANAAGGDDNITVIVLFVE